MPHEKSVTQEEALKQGWDQTAMEAENKRRQTEYEEQEKSKKFKSRKANSDASENALIKFYQPIKDIEETRKEFVTARDNEKQGAVIPFQSAHKYAMTIVNLDETNYHFLIKGAPEKIWSFCDKVRKDGKILDKDTEWEDLFRGVNNQLGRRGERVLGFASALVPKSQQAEMDMKVIKKQIEAGEIKFCFSGVISLMDPPRPGVPDAVAKCRSAGIKVVMVTGDQPVTAEAISKDVGIITGKTNLDYLEERGIELVKI